MHLDSACCVVVGQHAFENVYSYEEDFGSWLYGSQANDIPFQSPAHVEWAPAMHTRHACSQVQAELFCTGSCIVSC